MPPFCHIGPGLMECQSMMRATRWIDCKSSPVNSLLMCSISNGRITRVRRVSSESPSGIDQTLIFKLEQRFEDLLGAVRISPIDYQADPIRSLQMGLHPTSIIFED